jgi:putative heme-binding domain-containing protein
MECGPAMTGVASRMSKELIIESILEPNAKLDPKFLTTNVETKGGDAYSGFILKETPEVLTMRIAGDLDQDIKKSDIAKRDTVKQSSMPEGLAGGMSPTEFIDLIEFLNGLKAPAAKK